jgi:hypothetical protein
MRFPYDIVDASYEARNKLTVIGRYLHENFDARPDRAHDTHSADAVLDDMR